MERRNFLRTLKAGIITDPKLITKADVRRVARRGHIKLTMRLVDHKPEFADAAFEVACEKGHLEVVNKLKLLGDQAKGFRLACKHNQLEVVKVLYSRDRVHSCKNYALRVAIKKNFTDLALYLIQRKDTIVDPFIEGVCATHNLVVFVAIVNKLPNRNFILQCVTENHFFDGARWLMDCTRYSPLELVYDAVLTNDIDIVRYALDRLQPGPKCRDRLTTIAYTKGCPEVFNLLYERCFIYQREHHLIIKDRNYNLQVCFPKGFYIDRLLLEFLDNKDLVAVSAFIHLFGGDWGQLFKKLLRAQSLMSRVDLHIYKSLRFILDNHRGDWSGIFSPNVEIDPMLYAHGLVKRCRVNIQWDRHTFKHLSRDDQKRVLTLLLSLKQLEGPLAFLYKHMRGQIIDQAINNLIK